MCARWQGGLQRCGAGRCSGCHRSDCHLPGGLPSCWLLMFWAGCGPFCHHVQKLLQHCFFAFMVLQVVLRWGCRWADRCAECRSGWAASRSSWGWGACSSCMRCVLSPALCQARQHPSDLKDTLQLCPPVLWHAVLALCQQETVLMVPYSCGHQCCGVQYVPQATLMLAILVPLLEPLGLRTAAPGVICSLDLLGCPETQRCSMRADVGCKSADKACKRLSLHVHESCLGQQRTGSLAQEAESPSISVTVCAGTLMAYRWTLANATAVAVSSLLGLAVSLTTFLVIGAVGAPLLPQRCAAPLAGEAMPACGNPAVVSEPISRLRSCVSLRQPGVQRDECPAAAAAGCADEAMHGCPHCSDACRLGT